MAIDVIVHYNGAFLPDIILTFVGSMLLRYTIIGGTRLIVMKSF